MGPPGEVEGVVDERQADDLSHADGDYAEVIALQMDDGRAYDVGEQGRGKSAYGEKGQYGDLVACVQDGRDICADGIEARMPQVEEADFTEHDVEAQS